VEKKLIVEEFPERVIEKIIENEEEHNKDNHHHHKDHHESEA